MASEQEQKEQARREREERERAADAKARRNRRLQIVGGVLAAAVIIVIVAIVVSSSGGKKHGLRPVSPKAPLGGRTTSSSTIAGIPQKGMTLGQPNAPVTIHEYADLQCPVCDDFSLNVLPRVIQAYVRTGKVKIVYENYPILGKDSVTAAYAAAAAGMQNKAWDFIDLWYRNQGEENSGYVTPAFITKIATGAGLDVPKLMSARNSPAAKSAVRASTATGDSLQFSGTPSFVFVTSSGKKQLINGAEPTYGQLSSLLNTLLTTG